MKNWKTYFDFYSRKIHSLMGVIPLGLFLTEHLLVNSTALYGEEAFNKAAGYLHSLPAVWALEIVIIALPLTYHAVFGLIYAIQAVNNPLRYPHLRNWLFYFQRITGLITFAFVIYHLFALKFNSQLAHLTMYQKVTSQFANPWGITFYSIGLTAAAFHFANGLWGFALNWGIISGPRAQTVFSYLTIALFLGINLFGHFVLISYI